MSVECNIFITVVIVEIIILIKAILVMIIAAKIMDELIVQPC